MPLDDTPSLLGGMVVQVYRPRRPKESPLWQCLCAHFYDFIQAYPEKYEQKVLCHIHALVADGLFTDNGMFYVAPRVSTTPLEQLFRVRVIRMRVEEELLAPELARKLLGWKHSGFSVHNGKPLRRDDAAGLNGALLWVVQ